MITVNLDKAKAIALKNSISLKDEAQRAEAAMQISNAIGLKELEEVAKKISASIATEKP